MVYVMSSIFALTFSTNSMVALNLKNVTALFLIAVLS